MINWRKFLHRGHKWMGVFENRKIREGIIPAFTVSDWILIWLALDNTKAVRGKTSFVKQLFVTGKEIVPQMDRIFAFFPHRYGPYSKEFEVALQDLIQNGFINENVEEEIEGFTSSGKRFDYLLLPAGEKRADDMLMRIPASTREKLAQYRRLLSRMGFWGIIQYVYSNYPEYTTSSEIRLN